VPLHVLEVVGIKVIRVVSLEVLLLIWGTSLVEVVIHPHNHHCLTAHVVENLGTRDTKKLNSEGKQVHRVPREESSGEEEENEEEENEDEN
jgi:hypothetical protein